MSKFMKLSRAEMKNVLGGLYNSGGGGGVGDVGSCSMYLPNGNGASGSSYSAGCTHLDQNSSGGYDATVIGVSRAEVESVTRGVVGAHWCCTDCASASWMQTCNPQ